MKPIPKGRLILVALGFAAAVNTGCSTGLAPSAIGTASLTHRNRWGACVEAEGASRLDFPTSAGTGLVLVGHEKWFLPGADPFPCHHSIEHQYAGMLFFDIPLTGPRIVSFVLRPDLIIPVRRRGRTPSSPLECTVRVSVSQDFPFTGSRRMPGSVPLFPGSLRTDTIRLGSHSTSGPPHPGIDVTSIAQQWQNGDIRNLGFVVSQQINFADDVESTCLFSVGFRADVEFEGE